MKAFGIRLTAGLATILFGAYAAALAQKDKQNDSQAWSAAAPLLTQPAQPIAGLPRSGDLTGDSESASTNPGQSLAALAANAFASSKPLDDAPAEVALVQHTEPVGQQPEESVAQATTTFSAPSAFLGTPSLDSQAEPEPASQPVDPEAADWMNPPTDGLAEPMKMVTEGSLSMSFASEAPGAANPQNITEPTVSAPVEASPLNGMRPPGFGDNALRMGSPGSSSASPAESSVAAATDHHQPMQLPGLASTTAVNQDQPFDHSQPEMASTGDANGQLAGVPIFGDAASLPNQGSGLRSPGSSPNEHSTRTHSAGTIDQPPPSQPAHDQLAQNSPGFGQPFQAPAASPFGRSEPQAPAAGFPPSHPQRFAALGQPAGLVDRSVPTGQLNPSGPPALSRVDPETVIGAPGDRRLEGAQSPSVVIHKRAPAEVQVGKPASFVIHVQNVGATEAMGVVVHDRVPAGMRLVDASPQPVMQGDLLMWQLGGMTAGEERTVTMKLVPETEGELGSVARVTFEAAASVRTISTRPELKIVQRGPARVTIGQQVEIDLEVSNTGTGDAAGVSLQEDVPEGLEHPRGRQLDNLLGTLASGEVRNQVLRLRATQPGVIQNTIRLVSADGLTASHTIDIEVVAPQLQVEIKGPSRRFLERQATYQVNVINTGTADATNVEFVVGLDRGFRFVSTDYEGAYDQTRHAVVWSLEKLPAGVPASVPLTLLPVEEGSRVLTIDARADLGSVARTERQVTVEGLAELSFQILNPGGPIEMGALSSYEITVNNSGSKADANIQVAVQLPPGLELVSADSQNGRGSTDGRGQVVFPPLGQLAQGQSVQYRLQVRGVAPGTHLVKAIVMSDAATVPVTKEESTLVYADQ